jgi:hypothetical protein
MATARLLPLLYPFSSTTPPFGISVTTRSRSWVFPGVFSAIPVQYRNLLSIDLFISIHDTYHLSCLCLYAWHTYIYIYCFRAYQRSHVTPVQSLSILASIYICNSLKHTKTLVLISTKRVASTHEYATESTWRRVTLAYSLHKTRILLRMPLIHAKDLQITAKNERGEKQKEKENTIERSCYHLGVVERCFRTSTWMIG